MSFVNGGYSGTINVPIKKIEGSITSSSCAIGMAFAELGGQVMYLGFATGGGGTSSSECDDFAYPINPGTIFAW